MNFLLTSNARLLASFLFALMFLVQPVMSQGTEGVYDPADPAIGYNLVSFKSNNWQEMDEYLTAIDELAAVNADHVNLVVYRRVGSNGRVDFRSGPNVWTIYRAAQWAKANNLKVTITPIFETETESGWRGDWNPTGTVGRSFRSSYSSWLRQLTYIAAWTDADKLNVGSELVAFVNNSRNKRYLNWLVKRTARIFQGEVGYNSNWDNFQSSAVEEIFWDHPRINSLSISMYPYKRLASFEESDQSHIDPAAFAEKVKNRWREIVMGEILPYAADLKNGEGMPVAIGEFGAVALNRCAAIPASFEPSDEVDTKEQEAVIMGLIQSVDQLGFWLPEVTVWQWGIGDVSDRFGLNPFHESPQQSTALEILRFMQTAGTPEFEESLVLPMDL